MVSRGNVLLGFLITAASSLVTISVLSGQDANSPQAGAAANTSPKGDKQVNTGTSEPDDDEIHSTLRPSVFSRGRKQAGMSADEKKWISENCQWDAPRVEPTAGLGPIIVLSREGYVLGHSSLSKIPYWVCEHVTPEKMDGPGDRHKSKFKPDPRLDQLPRATLRDYAKSGYDRGHMAPAADEATTQAMMDDCHFLSNMAPQVGKTFNQGIWKMLEETVRKWTKKRGESWVITGPVFYDPLEETEVTADGIIPHSTIGPNHVAVPTHCYKIVLAKNEKGDWESIAFVLDNKTYGRPYQLSHYVTTIDWIEERTGLDFFPELTGDPASLALMNRLEGTKSAMWEEE